MNSLISISPNLALPSQTFRGARAARDFEAYLIGSLLESLQKTFAGVPGQDSLPGSEDYNYLATRALAEAIADRGGFGIANLIRQHLPGHEGKGQPVPNGDGARPPQVKFG